MNNPIVNLLATTNWWFVVVAVICSLIIWMVRYNQKVFGRWYGQWMGMPTQVSEEERKLWMARGMKREILSRVLYFIGLSQALMIGGWTDMTNGLIFAVVVRAIFVLPTQMSQVAWSPVNTKVLWFLSGKILVETLVVTMMRFLFFQ